jgi:hypothetical protein
MIMGKRLAIVLAMLIPLISGLPSVSAQMDNTNGTYLDPQLGFLVTWDPTDTQAITVVGGGIILVHGGQQLLTGPDRHKTAKECVAAKVKTDLLDTPLLFRRPITVNPEPEIDGLGARYSAAYAWSDGFIHYAWFGCVPITTSDQSGFLMLRLLARDEDWGKAVGIFNPILAQIALPGAETHIGTPIGSPAAPVATP